MKKFFLFLILTTWLAGCSESDKALNPQKSDLDISHTQLKSEPNPDKNAYFGDLHVHTSNSFDAYTFGTLASPSDAYRFAQGEAIPHPTGYKIQLKELISLHKNKIKSRSTFEDGYMALKLANAAYKSLRLKKTIKV